MEFDAAALARELAGFSIRPRAAFCADISERLLPNFQAFSKEESRGDPQVLRSCLDQIWNFVRGDDAGVQTFRQIELACQEQAPEPGDFGSDLASAALDAANAISATARACIDGSIACCVEVATYARDTVDMFIQIRDSLDNGDANVEAKIASDPLMQRELMRQSATLHRLRSNTTVEDLEIYARQQDGSLSPVR